ncbi:MAG: hypothetical protein AAFX78_01985 [Cyanobacteria bacterium J06638_20]
MPINQTSWDLDSDLYEGQILSSPADTVIYTGINADSVIVPFGRMGCLGTGGESDRLPIILPVDANSKPMGIIARSPNTFEQREGYSIDANGDMGYPLKRELGYMVRGVIAVYVDEAVAVTDDVFWIHTAYTGAKKGQFRTDANTDKAVQLTGAQWRRPATAGTLVPLAINLV